MSSAQGNQGRASGGGGGPRVATIHTINQNQPPHYGGGQFAEQPANPTCREMCANCLRTTPLITLLTMVLCITLWIYSTAKGGSKFVQANYALSPAALFWMGEVRLMLSSAFFHLGVLHIIFNMLVTYFVLKPVERSMGSLAMVGQILSTAVISSLIYCTTFWMIYKMFNNLEYMLRGVAGFSGVIFFYIPLVLAVMGIPAVNFCGFQIPTAIYPWFILLLTSLGGGVSFMGHLSGLLTSYLYIFGLLNWLSFPRSWLVAFESQTKLGELLKALPGWIPTPERMNDNLLHKQISWTQHEFESTTVGSVVNSVATSCANVCCCNFCLTQPSAQTTSHGFFPSGGIPSRGGNVLGADSDSDLELGQGRGAQRPAASTGYRLGDDPPTYASSYQSEARAPTQSNRTGSSSSSRPGQRPAQAIAELAQAARGHAKPSEGHGHDATNQTLPSELSHVSVASSGNQARSPRSPRQKQNGYSQLDSEGDAR